MRAALVATVILGLVALTAAVNAPAAGTAVSAKRVKVTLKEWTLTPSASRVPAGKVAFVVSNKGNIQHEFVILRTNIRHQALPMAGSAAKVRALAEIEDIEPGQTKRLTLTLKAGKYVLLCNVPGHYKAGQHAALRVG